MAGLPTPYLLFNGLLVILFGMFTGIPLRYAIIQKKDASVLNAWRVAHSVLVMDGLWLLIIGLALPYLVLDRLSVWILVWSQIASGYGFVIAFTVGPWKGIRGLTLKPYGLNTFLFGAHTIGAIGALIGTTIAAYGSLKALLAFYN